MMTTQTERLIVPKLVRITSELHDIFKRGTADVIQIGRLLRSAKKEVGHGEFLPWLKREFSLSEKSAQRYMAAHQFMTEVAAPLLKSDKLTDLKVRPSALYELIEMHSTGTITEVDIEAILREAAHDWIGKSRLLEIHHSRHLSEAAFDSEGGPEAELVGNGDTGIAGGTCDAPDSATSTIAAAATIGEAGAGKSEQSTEKPPATAPRPKSAPSARDEGNLRAFAASVLNLKRLAAGTFKKYAVTAVPTADLETVAEFLRAVADLKKVRSAENGTSAEATAEVSKAQYAEAEAA